jgi:hypothetical protein
MEFQKTYLSRKTITASFSVIKIGWRRVQKHFFDLPPDILLCLGDFMNYGKKTHAYDVDEI